MKNEPMDTRDVGALEAPYARAIPRSTPWPLVAAFGCTLLFAGIVTHIFVTFAGAACAIVGLVGWFREVFPHEATEEIPVEDCAIPLPPPVIATRVSRHSARRLVPEEIHPYRSGFTGGLVGGSAMALVACAWGLVSAKSFWMPINLLAGVVLPSIGTASEDALKSFNATWFACAVFLHVALSVMVGTIFVVSLPMMPRRPLFAGGVIAPILWTGVAWASLHVVNPTLEQHISWPWFLASQFAFGFACGAVVARATKVRLRFGETLAERLDVEQSKGGER